MSLIEPSNEEDKRGCTSSRGTIGWKFVMSDDSTQKRFSSLSWACLIIQELTRGLVTYIDKIEGNDEFYSDFKIVARRSAAAWRDSHTSIVAYCTVYSYCTCDVQ